MAILQKDLASTWEKASEVDVLRAERVRLIARCGELEEEVHRGAVQADEIPPEVVRKITEDYLASEEFQKEKFECAMDGHSGGFNECVHQVRDLDPSFDVTRLKADLEE